MTEETTLSTPTGYRRGFMFVLSSPSGAGKTTLSRRLLQEEQGIIMSVSVTTRPMRAGEVDGKDYFFIDDAKFTQMVSDDALLEHATVFGKSYGTPADFVSDKLTQGIDVLFDIDWQGTRELASRCRDDLVSVFILPPSMQELEQRLRGRGLDSEEVVQYRMDRAASEIKHWDEYDYVVVNRNVDTTLQQIRHILHAERYKRLRQTSLPDFVTTMCASRPSIHT